MSKPAQHDDVRTLTVEVPRSQVVDHNDGTYSIPIDVPDDAKPGDFVRVRIDEGR